LVLALVASGHAILYKRDSRSAVAWVGLIWLSPILGSILYWLFGVNRIRKKAVALRLETERPTSKVAPVSSAEVEKVFGGAEGKSLAGLVDFIEEAVNMKLTGGNKITPFQNGDEAYPKMLEAIEGAEQTVSLATYIFDRDEVGKKFVKVLAEAVSRKVTVRVLVDAVGARYSFPSILHLLKKHQIPCARFLPTLLPWRMPYMNLRNHRKTLVVDGKVGFTGGLNIREGNIVKKNPEHPIKDLHFGLEGPVVEQLQEGFVKDWAFSTDEVLHGEGWFPPLESKGSVFARGIPDGPGKDFEKIRWAILGGISKAHDSIKILTPYFLPDSTIISALNVAAMSGIKVEIVLPAENNLKFVQWASMSLLWQLLQRGCRVYLSEPPFDHSKVMIVDDAWVLLGSSNWDPRSLRLNFEYNVECYDKALASDLTGVFESKKAKAKELTLFEVDSRSFPIKIRDGIARLFTPYL